MNKDLDDRLVPNGEYRDALNIEIASSEGSDVGAVQNILGTTEVVGSCTGVPWDTGGSLNDLTEAVCIGTLADTGTERIYWFISSDEASIIAEFDQTTNTVRPILVEPNSSTSFLKFSEDFLITGVNILDDMLMWTDNQTEPKKINISDCREGSSPTNFTTHTKLYGRDFIQSDITVIKKSPLASPTLEMKDSSREGILKGIIPAPRDFSGIEAGEFLTDIIFPGSALEVGDVVILTAEHTLLSSTVEDYEIRGEVVEILQGYKFKIKIISISEDIPTGLLTWDIEWEDAAKPLFELKFPRFGYRWKYNSGEYSCMSPFSEVAFMPGEEFEYEGGDAYNAGMVNHLRELTIKGFETPPKDVVEVDILYTDSVSTNVYVVDTVVVEGKVEETAPFVIKSDLIHKIVPAVQLLRPWDNVPAKAKAQEIVGNRLIYGNYLQNRNIPKSLELNTAVSVRDSEDSKKSLKSDRTYQVGVVWKDEFGRETPVFSSSKCSVNVPISKASLKNQLSVEITSAAPDWATHYKYFIKETSNEYYNLSISRAYVDDEGFYWLSFPSAERNKISEGDYFMLKKAPGNDISSIANSRFKALSIENDAPDFIAKKTVVKHKFHNIKFQDIHGDSLSSSELKPQYGLRGATPGRHSRVIKIGSNTGFPGDPNTLYSIGSKVRFGRSGSAKRTDSYEIESAIIDEDGGDELLLYFTKEMMEDTDFLFKDLSIQYPSFYDGIFIELVEEENNKDEGEYKGRFFVKIQSDSGLVTALSSAFSSEDIFSATASLWLDGYDRGGDGARKYYSYVRYGGRKNTPATNISADEGGSRMIDGITYHFSIESGNKHTGSGDEGRFAVDHEPFLNTLEGGKHISFSRYGWSKEEEDKKYLIKSVYREVDDDDNLKTWHVELEEDLEKDISFYRDVGRGRIRTHQAKTIMTLWEESTVVSHSSKNPAIIETEPKESIDMDIYYETQETWSVENDKGEVNLLGWFNCYSFGNGVESNRIRDDYNAPTMGKGIKVSSVLDEPYEEERRGSGLIFSGIYNSTSGVNRLNQFIQAEPITKDLNPDYGTIQKLHTRAAARGNLVVLCEDKVLQVLADKDALYNADGSANLTSSNRVLGQAVPYVGEFGIGTNPESFAGEGFRAYFADRNRGVVLRLSRDGITEISRKGMSGWFRDNLAESTTVIGNIESRTGGYNLTLNGETVTFKEAVDGWVSRKSFIPEGGLSLNNKFYTFKGGKIWGHDNQTRNNFYGTQFESSVSLLLNDAPSSVKDYKTVGYEGTSSRKYASGAESKKGWYLDSIKTDLQSGSIKEFINKEGKWFNHITGDSTYFETNTNNNIDTKEFSVQGIGLIATITGDTNRVYYDLEVGIGSCSSNLYDLEIKINESC